MNLVEWTKKYDDAQTSALAAHMVVAQRREQLAEINDAIKDTEADAIMAGKAIGSNDSARTAALRSALADDGLYQDLLADQRRLIREAAESEAQRDDAIASMRIARLNIEHAIAELYHQSAINGGVERNERNTE